MKKAPSNRKSVIKKDLIKSDNRFPVVAVGASAGGLSAFKQLVKSIPLNSGMAYVLVQHLDPSHQSLLPELLQKITKIPVREIIDKVEVEPDHIYIMPSNKMLLSNDGKLELSTRPGKYLKRKNMPIDLFFESLAEVHQSHAIGVVLSGSGSDGTIGLKFIRGQGGITFAQDEVSAEFKGMPVSAVREGVVDFILPPEEIPGKILEITKDHYSGYLKEEHLEKKDSDIFKKILTLLRIRKGTDFTYYKQTTIRRRILRRMALRNVKNPAAYLDFLRDNNSEQDVLYQDLLIPVTGFFRDPEIFENLCNTLFPRIIENGSYEDTLRIWVAGCSTGQEVYSIAICLLEYFNGNLDRKPIQIFGSDLSEEAVSKARTGKYKKIETEEVSPERLKKFFNKIDSSYQVKEEVREICIFAKHNFLKDPPFGKMDFISCRNVFIYMQPYLQKKALHTFHYSLKKNGYLLLGKSENISNVPELFSTIEKTHKIFMKKDKAGKFMQVTSRRNEENFQSFGGSAKNENVRTNFQRTADEMILSKYTPAGVVIDEAMDIVHFRGSTGAYLEFQAGKPNLNLLKMAKTGLGFELRSIIHRAKKDSKPILKENILVNIGNSQRKISIEAVPLSNLAEPYFLILFHDSASNSEYAKPGKERQRNHSENLPGDEKDLRIEQLEKELAQTREDMRSITEDQEATNEELQSTNEELQSSGEELQSLNEELETSREELQSANEELSSVNQELLNLNKNLSTARNFTQDILGTIREPWIVLDKKFTVKSASNAFFKIFHTRKEETENKLIFELGNNQWNIPELKNLMETILPQHSHISDFEVTHNFPVIGERTMIINAREILREEGGEKLMLIVFEDVTDKRIAEKNIEKSEIKFKLLADSIPQLIWITNAAGNFEYFNSQWENYVGISKYQTMEDKWMDIVHQDDLSKVLEAWKVNLKTGDPFSMEYRLKNKEGEYHWFLAKAVPLFNSDGEIVKWYGSYTNIELQKEAQNALRKSRGHFRKLAELLPEKVTQADAEGTMEYFNKNWQDFTGMSQEELKRYGWFECMHPDERKEIVRKWKIAMKTGNNFEVEMRCLGKNGEYKWHLSRAIPVKDDAGNIRQWIGATTEIQKIKEEEKRRESFLQLVSHELKTPITSIKGYVQLLLSMLENEKNVTLESLPLRKSLSRIDDQVGRLTRLISEMLDLSRIEENKLDLKKQIFSLNEIVSNTIQDIRSTRTEHRILLKDDFDCHISADQDRIGQVIINLVTNAIKYSPDNKEIEVSIFETADKNAAVSIKDKGIGIAPVDQKEIFKRFHRVSGRNEETYSGLGIGLFLTSEIIDRHGGSITVESKLGEGSNFTFILPCILKTQSKKKINEEE